MASTSNTQLAQLLSESYQEIESLRHSLAEEKRRADHFQKIAETLKDGLPPSASSSSELFERVRAAEERAYNADRERNEEAARRQTITQLWHQLRDYLNAIDAHGSEARRELDRMIEMKTSARDLRLLPIPQLRDVDVPKSRKRRNSVEHAHAHKKPRHEVRLSRALHCTVLIILAARRLVPLGH